MADPAGQGETAAKRCRVGFHRWAGGRRANANPEPFSLSPVVGERVCRGCGKQQRFLWDSQGGAWEPWLTVRGGESRPALAEPFEKEMPR